MLKLAWRNIWRNKGRSLITIAAVMFCVVFAVVLRSFQVGVWEHMTEEIVGENLGYIQIHENGFWGDQSLDRTLDVVELQSSQMGSVEGVDRLIPRLETFSLLYFNDLVKGSLVMGVDPEKELSGFQLESLLLEGTDFKLGEQSTVVSEGLANYFDLTIGDSLIFMGQGHQGASAYGNFRVNGIVRLTNPELNKQLVLLPLDQAQWLYNCEGRATTAVVALEKGFSYEAVARGLKSLEDERFEVLDWKELFPEITQTIEVDMAGGQIFVSILYFIISFVLLGTVIMMVAERQREFGILISIGMKRRTLALVTVLENLMLTMGGAITGMAVVKPIQFYFKFHPIDLSGQMKEAIEQFNFEPKLYTTTSFLINLNHGIIIFVIGVLVSGYAVWKILRLDPVKSMRS
jgi:ABC-type lipoprotein release transport system permease subunit